MIIVKTDTFTSAARLALYINENNIKREDILSIVEGAPGFTIFFYGDPEKEEITHGLFS
ncbi:hypothetical protein [Mucilaginibacter sp. FT3.2]|uniref:hypothetical protein n=1 Tax=Mucilaginibacter sp. FT3.2 TaxID=2723090 RepID=UPI00160AEDC4|nr:hypothetical protein [Mucilaginibacter sp. FT3.2]MBB6235257.1 hypothetical protein [Mucilaginibacter sp. FT3.2]